jgi:hypothetical protein
MKIKNTISLLLLLSFSFTTSGQGEKPYREPDGLNNWYVELGGAALFYSLNYEKILVRENGVGWVGRVGAGYFPVSYRFLNRVYLDQNTFMAPFTTSVLLGKRKEKIEVGAGFTLLSRNFNEREFVPSGVLGFRVLEMNNVCFRISYTPFIRGGTYNHWMGVSIGRNFNFR